MSFQLESVVFPAPQHKNLPLLPFLRLVPRNSQVRHFGLCMEQEFFQTKIPIYQQIKDNRPILYYLHANAEDILTCLNFVSQIARYLNFGFIIQEYPGYSYYTQKPDQSKASAIQQDAVQIYDLYNSRPILVMGRSIGTGPAVWLGTAREPIALVLLSPFTCLKRLAKDKYGWLGHWLIAQHFNNKKRARDVTCPSLIIHGDRDQIVNVYHSRQLVNQFKDAILIEQEQAKHGNLKPSSVSRHIETFLQWRKLL